MFVSCSTRQRVGWRDYAERKVKTWLCPGLPRLCNTRAVCTVIMNQSKRPSSYGQLKGRSAMPDEVSRPHFVFFVAAGAAHLDVTVTCFTCLETLQAQRRRPFHLARGIPCATLLFFRHSRGIMCMVFTSLVSLCFSSSTFWKKKKGVLVSMVLFHTLVSVISFFSGYSVTLSRDLRDVDVGVLACTH